MFGVVFYLTFLILAFIMVSSIFREQPAYIKIWLSLMFGTLGLMWGVVPFAFVLGFNMISHMLALVLFGGITFLCFRSGQKNFEPIQFPKKYEKIINPETGIEEVIVLPDPTPLQKILTRLSRFFEFKWDKSFTALVWVTVPLMILISVILFSHVLDLKPEGYYGGQSTYGDLSLHLGITTSIAEQGSFPPDYSISPGTRLSYPFLVDSLSSSLLVMGSSLPLALLFPSLILILCLIMGFFILAYEFIKNRGAAILATVLFFINGGLGFFYFLDANYIAVADGKLDVVTGTLAQNFNRLITAWYNTPTNFNQLNIRWSNIIADMIIPQRTTLAGWTFVILAFWLLFKALNTKERKFFIAAGITGGLLPMINTHAFLGFGIIALVWAAIFLFQDKEKWKYIKNWLWLGVPLLALAVPQLLFWTLTQTGGKGFLELTPKGWPTIGDENFIWFWVKNVGVVFILLVPALFAARKKMLSFMAGPVVLFIVANLIKFQPNDYDNNKLFYIWYIFSVILVCSYIWSIYIRMKGMQMRFMLIAVIVAFGTISGGLTLAREINSGGTVQQYNNESIKAADFIKANTPKRATFLTGRQHLNPVAALAGRNIVFGTDLYLFFHGVSGDERKNDIQTMYSGGKGFETLRAKYNVDYVFISSYERNDFKADEAFFRDNFPLLKSFGDISIYIVSPNAVSFRNNGK
ncbi:MAG: hypothetical protein WCQ41_06525 [Bacillota bacterium]